MKMIERIRRLWDKLFSDEMSITEKQFDRLMEEIKDEF